MAAHGTDMRPSDVGTEVEEALEPEIGTRGVDPGTGDREHLVHVCRTETGVFEAAARRERGERTGMLDVECVPFLRRPARTEHRQVGQDRVASLHLGIAEDPMYGFAPTDGRKNEFLEDFLLGESGSRGRPPPIRGFGDSSGLAVSVTRSPRVDEIARPPSGGTARRTRKKTERVDGE